ncbi:MAG TPA: hypothetical protein VGY53_12175, partial [Isosphaeraceae bacterium]|nr:hypothetical protein [Isosphaeraceae bacterium]
PRKVKLSEAQLVFRFDREGKPLTKPPLRQTASSEPLPEVAVEKTVLILAQEGRHELKVVNLDATAKPKGDALRLAATANDPNWGRWNGDGEVNATTFAGKFTLGGLIPSADPEKEACIPFVMPQVWDHVVPRGPVQIGLNLRLDPSATNPVHVDSLVGFRHTDVMLPAIGLHGTDVVGDLTVNDGIVLLKDIHAQMLAGRVTMNGPLDFTQLPTRIELALGLDQIEVADLPSAWGMGTLEAKGRLSGKVPLKVSVGAGPLDFSATTGIAEMAKATLRGIPVENVHIDVPAAEPDARGPGSAGVAQAPAQQAPAASAPKASATGPESPAAGPLLPPLVVAELRVADVPVERVRESLAEMGVKLPPVEGGRIWADGRARIPLGHLADVDRYDIRGQARLVQFTVEGTDYALVQTPFELVRGVLEFPRFDGRLADRPAGFSPAEKRAVAGKSPAQEPKLATSAQGVFHGQMRAEVAPMGKVHVKVEGERLQLSEVLAPVLPRPTPVTGEATIEADAVGRLDSLGDTKAWQAHGQVKNGSLVIQAIALDRISTRFQLADGQIELPDVQARLAEQPIRATIHAELSSPFPFRGRLDADRWNISDAVRLTKGAQHAEHLKGFLSAQGDVHGTMSPFEATGNGQGRLDSFQTGSVAIGGVAFKWVLRNNELELKPIEARPFGGGLTGQAYVPLTGVEPVEGSSVFSNIDAGKLASALGANGLELNGKGSGEVKFTFPPGAEELSIKAHLTLPALSIRGVPYQDVVADLHTDKGTALYEVNAQSLGGKVLLKGNAPLFESDAASARSFAMAELHATRFSLARVWQLINVYGPLHNLDGEG